MSTTYRVEVLASESESGESVWALAPIHGTGAFAPPVASGLDLSTACGQALLGSRHGLARVVNESTGLALDAAQLISLRGEVQS